MSKMAGALMGLGQGLSSSSNILAQYLAARQQRAGMEQQQGQFDASQALQEAMQGKQLLQQKDQFDTQNRNQQNQFGLEQMERDRKNLALDDLLKDPKMAQYGSRIRATGQMFQTPDEQQALQDSELKSNQTFTADQNRLNRASSLAVAGMYGPRRQNPQEAFQDDLRGFMTRQLSNADESTPEERMAQLRQFIQMGSVMGGYKMDPSTTEKFIAPGIDPYVKNRFGGDYGRAIESLSKSDPVAYAQLLQMGVDPDRVLSAIQQQKTSYDGQQNSARNSENLAALRGLMGSAK